MALPRHILLVMRSLACFLLGMVLSRKLHVKVLPNRRRDSNVCGLCDLSRFDAYRVIARRQHPDGVAPVEVANCCQAGLFYRNERSLHWRAGSAGDLPDYPKSVPQSGG